MWSVRAAVVARVRDLQVSQGEILLCASLDSPTTVKSVFRF